MPHDPSGPRATPAIPEPLSPHAMLGLWLAAVATHLPSLRNGFPLDDAYILANPAIQSLRTVGAALGSPWWYGTRHLYRPLTLGTLAVERAVTGGHPVAYHAVNLVLHGVVTVLLARLLARFVGLRAAVAGALLFALVPGHAEAVATVVGRAELLAAAWMLLLALLVTRAHPPTSRERIVAALLSAAALASKEGGVAAPAIAFAVASTSIAQRPVALRWAASAAIGTLAMLTARLAVLGTLGGDLPNPVFRLLSAGERIALALAIVPRTVATLFLPLPAPIDYVPTLRGVMAPSLGLASLGAVLVLAATALLLAHLRRPSVAGMGAWIAAATVAPTVNLLFPSGVVLSGRTLYAPALGAAVLVAALVSLLERRGPVWRVAMPAGAAVLLASAVASWRESAVWQSSGSAIAAMQARHPDDYRSYLHLAYTARDSGRDVEAIEHFRAAAARFPGDPEMLTDGATVALRLRDTVTARAWLERAVAVSPRAARARTRLFGVLLARGDSAAARRLLVEGLEREPGQRAWAALLASLDAGRPRRD
jgi:hypothetical protein